MASKGSSVGVGSAGEVGSMGDSMGGVKIQRWTAGRKAAVVLAPAEVRGDRRPARGRGEGHRVGSWCKAHQVHRSRYGTRGVLVEEVGCVGGGAEVLARAVAARLGLRAVADVVEGVLELLAGHEDIAVWPGRGKVDVTLAPGHPARPRRTAAPARHRGA